MTEKEARNPKPSPETVAGRLRASVINVATLPKELLKIKETLQEKEK